MLHCYSNNQTPSCSTSSSLNTLFSHDQSLLWNFSAVLPVQRLSYSIFGKPSVSPSESGSQNSNVYFCAIRSPRYSILNSENQLVTIDLQFQKKLLALVCEDKNEQHKNPHCGVYMSFVRPHKSRPGHQALALHTDPRFVISCEVIQHQDLFSH